MQAITARLANTAITSTKTGIAVAARFFLTVLNAYQIKNVQFVNRLTGSTVTINVTNVNRFFLVAISATTTLDASIASSSTTIQLKGGAINVKRYTNTVLNVLLPKIAHNVSMMKAIFRKESVFLAHLLILNAKHARKKITVLVAHRLPTISIKLFMPANLANSIFSTAKHVVTQLFV